MARKQKTMSDETEVVAEVVKTRKPRTNRPYHVIVRVRDAEGAIVLNPAVEVLFSSKDDALALRDGIKYGSEPGVAYLEVA